MRGIWSDLAFAARGLRRSRGFTIIAASSLALAIGANTTVFSVGKQLLFDRLDVPRASSLRLLASRGISYPIYEQLRAQNTVLGDLLAFHATAANVTVGDNAERVLLHEVSGNYDEVLGVRAQIGREIRPSDDTPGSPVVAMISDAFWNREFARSPAAIGRSIQINDVPATIIGVNPKGYPRGPGRDPPPDSGDGASRGLVAVGHRDRGRHRRVDPLRTIHEIGALRHRVIGSDHALERSRTGVDRGTGREPDPCTPRGPCTSDGRAST